MITQNLIIRSRSRIPAATLDGTLTLNGQVFDAGAGNAQINATGALGGLIIQSTSTTNGPVLKLDAYSASPAASDVIGRVTFNGRDSANNSQEYGYYQHLITSPTSTSEESSFQWVTTLAGSQNSAMTLSGAGALWTDASVDTLLYKVSGTQVVGARIVDARCDDVVDATYGAEEAGVLDALRDAMITHGLIAAA